VELDVQEQHCTHLQNCDGPLIVTSKRNDFSRSASPVHCTRTTENLPVVLSFSLFLQFDRSTCKGVTCFGLMAVMLDVTRDRMTPAHRLLTSLTIHSKLPASELALLLLICRRKKAYNCSIGKDYAKIISTLLITVVRSDRVPVPTKIVRAWELPPETNIDLDCRSSTKEHGGSSLLCCSKLIGRARPG
jgi:hypothetical protein